MELEENILPGSQWPEKESALKSPWIRGLIAMMAIIVTVNIIMITVAFKTSPGLVVDDYYEKGKNYNKSLEKMAAQKALGWDAHLSSPEKIEVAEKTGFGLTIIDRSKSPLSVDKVEVFAFRPSDAAADFSAQMILKAEGEYGGDLLFPLPGVWDLIVNVVKADDQFEITKRVFISKKTGL
ncbi:MAG: FixH family protein [bacterium]|nr:FixH family protein [bacterium]